MSGFLSVRMVLVEVYLQNRESTPCRATQIVGSTEWEGSLGGVAENEH